MAYLRIWYRYVYHDSEMVLHGEDIQGKTTNSPGWFKPLEGLFNLQILFLIVGFDGQGFVRHLMMCCVLFHTN